MVDNVYYIIVKFSTAPEFSPVHTPNKVNVCLPYFLKFVVFCKNTK